MLKGQDCIITFKHPFFKFTISESVEISPLFVVIAHLALEIISVFVFQYGVGRHLRFTGQVDPEPLQTVFHKICDAEYYQK